MKCEQRPDRFAVVLTPEPGDDVEDLEDRIDDAVLQARDSRSKVVFVVLDLSGIASPGPWLKAAGPQIPNVNLRVALGPAGFVVARALKLDAFFDWYPDVESALDAEH